MTSNEAREEKHEHIDRTSLRHARRRQRKTKLIFGVFSAALLISLILSLVLSR